MMMFSISVICSLLLICKLYTIAAMGNAVCNEVCTREHDPVCGTLKSGDKLMHCSFPNKCLLNVRKCKHHEDWSMKPGVCFKDTKNCRTILTH